ncbi:MAG TPA: TIM barrel protein [Thermomicrobiales bacterium]|nr:TIM barrel protein [Thermomicrobiales bacterium]
MVLNGNANGKGLPRYRFATRLNSFRSPSTASIVDLVEAVAGVPGLTAIEVNYPQHLQSVGEEQFLDAVNRSGLALTAISLRYDDAEFRQGVFTSPNAGTRERAILLTFGAVDLAARIGVPHVNLWMSHDGFDYPFEVDYARLWEDEIDGFRRVCEHNPELRISVEYKPLEPRRVSLIAGMSDALLAIQAVGMPNFGVQIDFCHSLMAREQPAAAAARALHAGRLFGVHLNDGYGPADDGLTVGSVHPWQTLELLWYLRRFDYRGTIYFDTFPERVDPAGECVANLRAVRRFERILDRLEAVELADLQAKHDALALTRLIQDAALGDDDGA